MSQPYLFKERRKCPSLRRLVGRSSVMLQVYQKIECLANTDTTVLIVGETGTGKELAAEANHRLSSQGLNWFKGKSDEIRYWNMGRGCSHELSYVWLLESYARGLKPLIRNGQSIPAFSRT